MKDRDVMGTALQACHFDGDRTPLAVNTSYGNPEEMTMDIFFRDKDNLPDFEWIMLDLAKGKTLDVGAGCGSHSLLLQEKNLEVIALEISEGACRVASDRGVEQIERNDYKLTSLKGFDTITMVMNGIGLVGNLTGFEKALNKFESMLNINGQILFDTTNIDYIYEGKIPVDKYYGEVSFQFEYKDVKGEWFDWLYLDIETIKRIGSANGWISQIVYDDREGHFVVKMKR